MNTFVLQKSQLNIPSCFLLRGAIFWFWHDSWLLKVRSFFRRCNDITESASCVCAVAVRSDDYVIVFDKCGAGQGETDENRPMTVSLYINGELTSGTSILRLRGGKKFRVGVVLLCLFFFKVMSSRWEIRVGLILLVMFFFCRSVWCIFVWSVHLPA